jgi:peptide/nickel transport system substrate-binding protein
LDLSTQYAPFGDVPRLRSSKTVELLDYTYPVIQWLGFKLSKPPFNDIRVRQAIADGLNRDELNSKGNNGVGIPSQYLYLTGHWATDSSVKLPAYNSDRAKQLLKDAGYADGFKTSLLVYEGYGAPELAQVIRELLSRIGIDVTLDVREWASYVDKGVKQKDFELFYGTGFTGPDPSMLQTFVGTGGFQNVGGYSSTQVDGLFLKAQAAADQAQAKVLYGQIERILAQDLPRLPLFDRKVVFPANPNFRDYWQQSSTNAIVQPERAYDRVWWIRGKTSP